MIQVQRFNKVLKLAVILGDLVILNVLFISFNSIWNELFGERACSGTLPQILTLFSVCYFACTISGGVILHRRGARADQNCIPGTPQRVLFLFFIDRTDGIIRT